MKDHAATKMGLFVICNLYVMTTNDFWIVFIPKGTSIINMIILNCFLRATVFCFGYAFGR